MTETSNVGNPGRPPYVTLQQDEKHLQWNVVIVGPATSAVSLQDRNLNPMGHLFSYLHFHNLLSDMFAPLKEK